MKAIGSSRTFCRRFRGLCGVFVLLVSGLFVPRVAADTIVLSDPEAAQMAEFGKFVTAVPDVNGDGKWDVAISSVEIRSYEGPTGSGKVTLFDGVTGKKLGTLFPFYAGQWSTFADSLSGIPDVNGDGLGDVIVGDAGESEAYIYDGKRHTVLRILHPPPPDLGLGWSVAGLPDIDGDGAGDVLMGGSRVYLFSGRTGFLIRVLDTPNPQVNGYFGLTLATVPDVNGDGKVDLLVGSLEAPEGHPYHAGRVYLFDGATTTILHTFISPNPRESGCFGWALAGIPDVNGDGRGDVLIGAPFESLGPDLDYAGRAYLFDGATGLLLRTVLSPSMAAYGGFGRSITAVPDLSGDGIWEIMIGAPHESGGRVKQTGRTYLYDGRFGRLLSVMVSPLQESWGDFGTAVAGLPDVNGDGRGDVIIGADVENEQLGRAYIFHLEPGPAAGVKMDWTLYGSGAPGFQTGVARYRTGRSSTSAPLPVK